MVLLIFLIIARLMPGSALLTALAPETPAITPGSYVQVRVFEGEPILWCVMATDTQTGTAKLISEYFLEYKTYSAENNGNWSDSGISF